MIEDIEIGQKWTHKLTSMAFTVAILEGNEVILEPEGEGQELTLTRELLCQEFQCPEIRRLRMQERKNKKIKPEKIRRGLRR